MKVLVVGSGGREHAIIWKLAKSERIEKLYCAPGNAGIGELAELVDIKATDITALADWVEENHIDLTVVGMEDPLTLGIVDLFESKGLKIFGAKKNAAILEGSKVFAKDLMKKYKIPTADYEVFEDAEAAKAYLETCDYPVVLKADGLALGKGVLICEDQASALEGVQQMMVDMKFGDSGSRIVVESFLSGPEVSVLSFCDGDHIIPMVSAQDHKRAFDNDEGLNTGGMGTFSPSKSFTQALADESYKTIFKPTLDAMKAEGRPFTGIIFFGLMITPKGVKVIEYNVRFGDPEAQVVLTRLKTDLLTVIEHAIDGKLDEITLEWTDEEAVCVILASGGYPVSYKKGYEITGLDAYKGMDDRIVFHAGTAVQGDAIVTNGGRVLGLTALGTTMAEARKKAYDMVEHVHFTDKQYRKDIGIKHV